jgi:hypothetical protein
VPNRVSRFARDDLLCFREREGCIEDRPIRKIGEPQQ